MSDEFIFKSSDGSGEYEVLSDEYALTLLQAQYGRATGAQFLSDLICGKSKTASVTAGACALGDGGIFFEPPTP